MFNFETVVSISFFNEGILLYADRDFIKVPK
jgi:hypothetical protein